MCFTMCFIDFHDLHHIIIQHRFMMHHPHHFFNISSLIFNNLWYVIVIYHLYMIMMYHFHHFHTMSSLILNISGYLIIIYHLFLNISSPIINMMQELLSSSMIFVYIYIMSLHNAVFPRIFVLFELCYHKVSKQVLMVTYMEH